MTDSVDLDGRLALGRVTWALGIGLCALTPLLIHRAARRPGFDWLPESLGLLTMAVAAWLRWPTRRRPQILAAALASTAVVALLAVALDRCAAADRLRWLEPALGFGLIGVLLARDSVVTSARQWLHGAGLGLALALALAASSLHAILPVPELPDLAALASLAAAVLLLIAAPRARLRQGIAVGLVVGPPLLSWLALPRDTKDFEWMHRVVQVGVFASTAFGAWLLALSLRTPRLTGMVPAPAMRLDADRPVRRVDG